jgi:outer membrane protein TolC
MKSLKVTLLLMIAYTAVFGQTESLDAYIREGIANNESIKQQNFNLEKSVYALKEATGLYMPNINLKTDYLDSRGGRTIDIPVGDLINPVYANLNQIKFSFGARLSEISHAE